MAQLQELSDCRRRLARIRCVQECIECFRTSKSPPKALCFIPAVADYKVIKNFTAKLMKAPHKKCEKVSEVSFTIDQRIVVSGEEVCNLEGQWAQVLKIIPGGKNGEVCKQFKDPAWLQIKGGEMVESTPSIERCSKTKNKLTHWMEVVDHTYGLGGCLAKTYQQGSTKHSVCSIGTNDGSSVDIATLNMGMSLVTGTSLRTGTEGTSLYAGSSIVTSTSATDSIDETDSVTNPSTDSISTSNPSVGNTNLSIESLYNDNACSCCSSVAPCNVAAVKKLCNVTVPWSLEHDEDLVQYLASQLSIVDEHLGSVKQYVDAIQVSSYCEDDIVENLTDEDVDTYWESDGRQGQHWIRLTMKKNMLIKKLYVGIDGNDDNYLPTHIAVYGGELDNMREINDLKFNQSSFSLGLSDVLVLEDQKAFYPIIEVRILECKDDGLDTRIHFLKIRSASEQDNHGLNLDTFTAEKLVRFPKLENFDPEVLYCRAQLLQRYMELFDSVLIWLVPAWEYTVGSYSTLEVVRQFLPLSRKRMTLIELFMRESETGRPTRLPKLYINRRAAADHKDDPSQDPDAKNSVFMQIYEGLKPRDNYDKALDYRWPGRYEQWWECKFLSEGIIDQGGGFRDSLSDLAEELCPSDSDVPLPLPFYIRTPNHSHSDSNVNRDVYMPNPACKNYHQLEWLGKVMGACLRGKENLVLSLASFVWKKLAGERVTWSRDYSSIDEAEVKMVENMAHMDEDSFDAYFSGERMWATVLSDGSLVQLRPDGVDVPVHYEERIDYALAVQHERMKEMDQQIAALRRGLLAVVPHAVLELLTWQELERRVCGDPEISVEALKRTAHYEDLEETDTRVKYMWEAIENFSNEDRSRLLRFITGRRRLPAPLYICPDKGEVVDALPEASTCSHMLYLPFYSSAAAAEEKLRYAAYNCIAIDTDMSPWDE